MGPTKFNIRGVFTFLDELGDALVALDKSYSQEGQPPPSDWTMFLLRQRLDRLKETAEADESELHTFDLIRLLTALRIDCTKEVQG